ncbi:GPI mannosyltransferase 2 [Lineolata rhizophorae]|uniref:GPI mannosyltransferase 2 n=1 Tax=Lineolata rhizophorae TaxID=578093 RepID=A0A6A6P9U2_9PEZI|nr:GPI mannosyltransferase 2 [Lineolata rhizophorae]
MSWLSASRSLDNPVRSLLAIWACWKTLLLAVVVVSPGPGYDTSTQILRLQDGAVEQYVHPSAGWLSTIGQHVALKLTRWDAIYFVRLAQRGYVHEQEWAFSWGFTRLINTIALNFPGGQAESLATHALIAATISHVSHAASVVVLYKLACHVTSQNTRNGVAFITAVLHVLSPAGIFLSAPYAEALFSLFNFSGMLFYVYSIPRPDSTNSRLLRRDINVLISGACFGLASFMRSNGLLSGLLFASDLFQTLPTLPRSLLSASGLRRQMSLALAGILTACGFVAPQWVAYREYCVAQLHGEESRIWCRSLFPSIYSFVQKHYWNVGFLRYWTAPNIPLFLIAYPTLYLMLSTSSQARAGWLVVDRRIPQKSSKTRDADRPETDRYLEKCLRELALPQLVLAITAVTNFHVQIISRIASGYPVWYFGVAAALVAEAQKSHGPQFFVRPKAIVRYLICYAVVQGGLFASFLPPA